MLGEIHTDIFLFFFGFLLTIIAALIGFITKAIIEVKTFTFKKVASLEADIKNTNRILSQIIIDLKIVEAQGTKIAVLQSQLADLRGEMGQVFKRIRSIEIDKIERRDGHFR